MVITLGGVPSKSTRSSSIGVLSWEGKTSGKPVVLPSVRLMYLPVPKPAMMVRASTVRSLAQNMKTFLLFVMKMVMPGSLLAVSAITSSAALKAGRFSNSVGGMLLVGIVSTWQGGSLRVRACAPPCRSLCRWHQTGPTFTPDVRTAVRTTCL